MKICHLNQDERGQDRARDYLDRNLPGYESLRLTKKHSELRQEQPID